MGERLLSQFWSGLAVWLLATVWMSGDASGFPVAENPEAINVVGQANFTTGFADPSSDPLFGAQPTTGNRFFVAGDVAYDSVGKRLVVADVHNHRVLVFDLSLGLLSDLSAELVLGQPDFVTGGASVADPFGNENTQNAAFGCTTDINACGMARAFAVALDSRNQRVFVSDPDNSRVLVWDLAAASNGSAAAYVLGQADFTTRSANQACGGGSSAVGACGLSFPTDLHFDESSGRLFVVDSRNNRVVVYDTASLANGMAASAVIGQPGFTTNKSGTSCGGTSTGVIDACSMDNPSAVTVSANGQSVFVGEFGTYRVTGFDISGGLQNGMAASLVLGQQNLNTGTVNTSCDGSANGDSNVNACGIGLFGPSVDFDNVANRLYVGDSANHRIMVFDASALDIGVPAFGVLGQADFTTGYNSSSSNYGGGTTRSRMVTPLGLAFDQGGDRLFVSDAGNHRVLVFGSNAGGVPINTGDDDGDTVTTVDAGGNTQVDVDNDDGVYKVIFPPGTKPKSGESEIVVESYTYPGVDFPAMRIQADLPAGTTKSVTIPNYDSVTTCIIDHENLTLVVEIQSGYQCTYSGRRYDVATPNDGDCETYRARGDFGDNPDNPLDVTGMHDVEVCTASDGKTVSVSGLNNSLVISMASANGTPSETIGNDLSVGGGGCNGSGPSGGLGLLLAGFALHLVRRRIKIA